MEQARAEIQRHEENAKAARREYLREEAERAIQAAEVELRPILERLFIIVRHSGHPMIVRYWVEKMVSYAEHESKTKEPADFSSLGLDVPPEIEELRRKAA